jgi:magnesium transporter
MDALVDSQNADDASLADAKIRETTARLLTLLDEDGPGAIQIAATALRTADLASVVETLEEDDRLRLFIALPPDIAGDVLEEVSPEIRDELLEASDDNHLTRILTEADADDAVYFLDHLDEDRAEHLLSKLDNDLRAQLSEQYELEDDVAARIMVHDPITLRSFMTAQQALDHIRRTFGSHATASANHNFSTLYVLDAEAHLVGVLPFRKLVFASPRDTLAQVMDKDVITVRLDTDREQVARLMQKYHLLTIAVVDDGNRIRGMVTWDDAVDVLEAEAEEDLLTIAGTSEDLEENAGFIDRARSRLPWLLITAVGGFINAKVIDTYGSDLKNQMLLLAFMPLVGALGGNIGLQCSTVTVRGLATGAIRPGTMLRSVGREIGTGILLAFAMALLCGLGGTLVALSSGDSPMLGVVMATSLLLAVLLAAALGVAIPLGCERFKIDPAVAAGPFITMLNDVTGYAIYITTVYTLLRVIA